ncbi:hypothetical protein HO173_002142 [Letharia columbiana]|uniref:C2H2-type domain-containing protein n=1 Tax=Letharia columbiana TaxID=112416 RepID=A0A8H6G2Z6_9LECA|nr:uncharacterized protein HO173_002142 [Letharia columbiana]KAF6239597.1 hypothetical protein HO173_002142 [Letharia columbiana]
MLKKDWLYGAAVSPDTELSPQQTIPHQSNASSSELSNHRLEIQDSHWENIQAAIDQLQKLEATLDGADPQELLRLKKNLTASDTMPFRLLDRDGNKLSGSVVRKTFGLHTSPSSEDDLQRKQGEQRRQENQQLETPLKRKSTDEPQQQNRQKRSKTTPVESSESSLECHRCGLGFSSLALLTDHLRSCRAKCERCNILGIACIELANHQGAIRKCTQCKEANPDCSGPITPVDEQKDTPQFSVLCPRYGSEVHRKYICGHSRECPGKCKSCVGQGIPLPWIQGLSAWIAGLRK